MAGSAAALTILIAARNAASTIERAVASCLAEPCALVLADDGSSDDTASRARALAGRRLEIVDVAAPGGVARARQRALDTVATPYAAWLDADDEWRPGRAARLAALLDTGYDIATEGIDLHDGATGAWLRRMTVPAYLRPPSAAVRLFERNHLPGDTQVAFRTGVFRSAGGYDAAINGPESYDVLLRAVRRGARIACGDHAGYRMYAYPGSVSRDLGRQRAALAAALRKHAYSDIRRLYSDAGYGESITAWALVIVAQYRGEPGAALEFLDRIPAAGSGAGDVLEPDGPWPQPEGWRRSFHRGAILLMMGGRDAEAAEALRNAESMLSTAEGINNLGVALVRMGHDERARACFEAAMERFPGYLDARLNASMRAPSHITTHPLRRLASRREY